MNIISTESRTKYNENIWNEIEQKYDIFIRTDIKDFFKFNNGGYPINDIIISDEIEYEIRAFLSLDENDQNYYIEKPLCYFLTKTNAKIIPIALDSGDNYYCVNNETGKVYFWSSSTDSYYLISDNIEQFTNLFN